MFMHWIIFGLNVIFICHALRSVTLWTVMFMLNVESVFSWSCVGLVESVVAVVDCAIFGENEIRSKIKVNIRVF